MRRDISKNARNTTLDTNSRRNRIITVLLKRTGDRTKIRNTNGMVQNAYIRWPGGVFEILRSEDIPGIIQLAPSTHINVNARLDVFLSYERRGVLDEDNGILVVLQRNAIDQVIARGRVVPLNLKQIRQTKNGVARKMV